MGRGIFVKQSGQWVEVPETFTKVSGSWSALRKGFVNVNGTWRQFYPPPGQVEYAIPGAYVWTVPPAITTITIDAVGGGGGGGGSHEVGAGNGGGGGGSGGYVQNYQQTVTPGERITITIGAGGAGAPFVGRTTDAPSGSPGQNTTIAKTSGTLTLFGGKAGGGAVSVVAGAGGAGGAPNGQSGTSGRPNWGADYTSSVGGDGGSNPFGTGGYGGGLTRTTNSQYCTFLNTYGVWIGWGFPVSSWLTLLTRKVTVPASGNYTIRMSADNQGKVLINGSQVASSSSFTTTSDTVVALSAGEITVEVQGYNTGFDASVGVVIYDSSGTIIFKTQTDNIKGAPGTGHGSGGGGAGATDRTMPLNWEGGAGANGYVKISW